MTGRIYFILVMTFITGMFAGVYLYITAFAPAYDNNSNAVANETEIDFLLHGKKVGECNTQGAVCPSFELRSDRTYTFVPQYVYTNATPEKITGKLGKNIFDVLISYIASIDLRALEEKTPHADCSPLYDTNYRYDLTYKGVTYTYDTCNTLFKESVLATKFYPLWSRLSTTTPQAPLLEEGITGFLRDKLDEQFQYDD